MPEMHISWPPPTAEALIEREPMQEHCDLEMLDDVLHTTAGSAFASEPIDPTDCMFTWELVPDSELAPPDVRGSKSSCASQRLVCAELCAIADQDARAPFYPATPGAHIEQTDLGQPGVTSQLTSNTPPPSFNENMFEGTDTPPPPDTPPLRRCTPSLGRIALVKRPKVYGKQSALRLRKQWAPDEEALFLKALAAFAKEIETTSDPATGRVSVHLDRGVAEMISMIVSSRSVAQVRSHVQKHYIRKAREAARADAATTSESEHVRRSAAQELERGIVVAGRGQR